MEHEECILENIDLHQRVVELKELVRYYQEMYVKADKNMRRRGYTMRYLLEMPDDDLTSGE